jgi:hypothetical protein
MNMPIFCDTVPCSLVEMDRRFRGAYYLHYLPDNGGSTHLRNVGLLQLHGAVSQKAAIFMLTAVRT